MKNSFFWEKELLKSTYKFFWDYTIVGKMNEKSCKTYMDNKLKYSRYVFLNQGLFKSHTNVLDAKSGAVVGTILYSNFLPKAKIIYYGKEAYIYQLNLFKKNWRVYDEDNLLMTLSGSFLKGKIECEKRNDLLMILGLYFIIYYTKMFVLFFILVCIPLLCFIIIDL